MSAIPSLTISISISAPTSHDPPLQPTHHPAETQSEAGAWIPGPFELNLRLKAGFC